MANYYETLGVSKTATQDEIKNAYRKLVKQYHPDLHPNDPNCAAKFKEINEANEVLSDPEKRRQYDYQQEHPNMGGFGGFEGNFSDFGGFGDIFGDIFSQFGGGGRGAREQTKKGQDVTVEVDLSFLDAVKGCNKEIKYNRKERCTACNGTGAKDGTAYVTCPTCKGAGQVKYTTGGGFFQTISVRACNDCGGSGKKIRERCTVCQGKGYNKTTTTLSIDIPAGADSNSYIKKRGYGDAPSNGGECGDLIVVFKVQPHKIFKRKDFNLYVELPIDFKTAALGGKVKIPTIDDAIDLTIPEGTQNGKTFLVKGRGIRSKYGSGDLYVTVEIEIPVRLNKAQKNYIAECLENVTLRQQDKMKAYSDNMSALYGVDSYDN